MASQPSPTTKPQCTVALIGEFDSGKSTLLGHMLTHKAKAISNRKFQSLVTLSTQIDRLSFAYSWVSDFTRPERERGITIDFKGLQFDMNPTTVTKTQNDDENWTTKFQFTMLDLPGHSKLFKNFVSGLSQADVGLLLIDVQTLDRNILDESKPIQTRLRMANHFGLDQLIIAINKMDSVEYSQIKFYGFVRKTAEILQESSYTPFITVGDIRKAGDDGIPIYKLKGISMNSPCVKKIHFIQEKIQLENGLKIDQSIPYIVLRDDIHASGDVQIINKNGKRPQDDDDDDDSGEEKNRTIAIDSDRIYIIPFIPTAAFYGANIGEKFIINVSENSDTSGLIQPIQPGSHNSVQNPRQYPMEWYNGNTIFQQLNSLHSPKCNSNEMKNKPLRIPIQNSYRIFGVGHVITGRICSGVLPSDQTPSGWVTPGSEESSSDEENGVGDEENTTKLVNTDTIMIRPFQTSELSPDFTSKYRSVESFHKDLLPKIIHRPIISSGLHIALVTSLRAQSVQRGMVISDPYNNPAWEAQSFIAKITLLKPENVDPFQAPHRKSEQLHPGYTPIIDCGTAHVPCRLDEIYWKFNGENGKAIEKNPIGMRLGDVVIAKFSPLKPLVLDPLQGSPQLSRFIIREGSRLIGTGVVFAVEQRVLVEVAVDEKAEEVENDDAKNDDGENKTPKTRTQINLKMVPENWSMIKYQLDHQYALQLDSA